MDDTNGVNQFDDDRPVSLAELEEMLSERFDVEALAQMVEHLDYADKLSHKLTSSFSDVRQQVGRQGQALGAVQQEIRDLIMDVALLKRAMASLGHVGVMERKRIERELVRELFPPTQPRAGAGVVVNTAQPKPAQKVNCEDRLHLCKAACCRIFNIHLTPQEVIEDNHDWDPRQPYALQKNRVGCAYLKSGGCACTIYESRPNTCRNYSCANDKRIWQDFEKMILNPELEKRLQTLQVTTGPENVGRSGNGQPRDSFPETGDSQAPSASLPEASVAIKSVPQSEEPSSTPKVAPPNFDELRNLMVPKPSKKFVPPSNQQAPSGNGSSSKNEEE